jgi:serine/threonine protein kinase
LTCFCWWPTISSEIAAFGELVGRTLGHYVIIERIGCGGMEVVYRTHDEQLDRDVAVKILLPGTLRSLLQS